MSSLLIGFLRVLTRNLVLLILLLPDFWKTISNYYKLRQYGGDEIDHFKHKSSSTYFSAAFLVLAMFVVLKWSLYAIDSVLLILIPLIGFINSVNGIRVYRNGLYFDGEFTEWGKMKSIKEGNANSLIIQLKSHKSWFLNVITLSKVNRKSELMNLLEKFIHKQEQL